MFAAIGTFLVEEKDSSDYHIKQASAVYAGKIDDEHALIRPENLDARCSVAANDNNGMILM